MRLVDPRHLLQKIPSGTSIQIRAKIPYNATSNTILVDKASQSKPKVASFRTSLRTPSASGVATVERPAGIISGRGVEGSTAAELEGDLVAVGLGNVIWEGGSSLFFSQFGGNTSWGDANGAETASASPPPPNGTDAGPSDQGDVYSAPPRVVADMSTVFYILDLCGMGGGPVATVQVG